MFARIAEWRKRAGVAFWRLADKRISKEWLVVLLGGLVLLVYVFVLFLGRDRASSDLRTSEEGAYENQAE
jgi:hypothetical protein